MPLDLDHLADRVADRTGTGRPDEARRAVVATLQALAAPLPPAETDALAGALPDPVAARVRRAAIEAPGSDDPFADLAEREGVPRALATEYAHVACQVIAEALPRPVADRVGDALPPPWRELFHRREAPPPPPPHHHAAPPGQGRTLATGRVGSRHPVADHAPAPAHAESVVRSDNPHADEKLSSGDVGGDHLADGRPPQPDRPIDEEGG